MSERMSIDRRRPTADRRLQTADGRPRTADRRLFPVHGGRRTAVGGRRFIALIGLLALAFAFAASAQTTFTIQEAMRLAVERSPDVAAARAAQREAAASAGLARSTFRPAATVSTTPGYATGLPVAILGSVPAIASVEAHQTLYDNFARVDVLSADAQADARALDIDNAERQTTEAAAQAYSKAAADRIVVANSRQRIEALRAQADRVAALLREGRATQLDVDRANLQVERAENQAASAMLASDVDEARLRQLTGWSGELPLSSAALQAPAGSTADHVGAATAHDEETRSLDRQIATLRRSVSILRHPFQPTIQAQTQYARLFGRYSRFYNDFKADDFSIGAAVVIPIWSGGRRAASVERVTAQLQRLEALRASRARIIESSVREAESDLNGAQSELRVASRAKTIAEEGLRIARTLAQEGRGDPNGVTASEVEVTDANDEIARAEQHVNAATAHLLAVRGELAPPATR